MSGEIYEKSGGSRELAQDKGFKEFEHHATGAITYNYRLPLHATLEASDYRDCRRRIGRYYVCLRVLADSHSSRGRHFWSCMSSTGRTTRPCQPSGVSRRSKGTPERGRAPGVDVGSPWPGKVRVNWSRC